MSDPPKWQQVIVFLTLLPSALVNNILHESTLIVIDYRMSKLVIHTVSRFVMCNGGGGGLSFKICHVKRGRVRPSADGNRGTGTRVFCPLPLTSLRLQRRLNGMGFHSLLPLRSFVTYSYYPRRLRDEPRGPIAWRLGISRMILNCAVYSHPSSSQITKNTSLRRLRHTMISDTYIPCTLFSTLFSLKICHVLLALSSLAAPDIAILRRSIEPRIL